MAKVTSFTSERMLAIENSTVIRGAIEGNDELVLYTRGGTRIYAGTIKGGTAEWIRDVGPVIEQHTEYLDVLPDLIDGINQDIDDTNQTVNNLNTAVNQTVPEAISKATEALSKAGDALDGLANTTATIETWYAVGSPNTAPTTGWTKDSVTRGPGQIIWVKYISRRVSGSIAEESTPQPWSGEKGDKGASSIMVTITSTNGTVFKKGIMDTNLVATVWYEGKKIEDINTLRDELGQSAHLTWTWSLPADNSSGVFPSTDPKISQGGFIIHITHEDVDVSAVFDCSVSI